MYNRQVYDNPAGVLTNNPPFPMQLFALNNYMQLSPKAVSYTHLSGQDRSLQNNVQFTFILSLFIGSHLPAGDPSASRTHKQTLLRG